jgi:uncharacterized protein involved in outer membrane biogenesis
MKKVLGAIAAFVFVAVIAIGLYLYFSFSSLVKTAVETYAPRITQTRVSLGGVSVSLFSGSASLDDLVVGNPTGFKSDRALALHRVAISLDTGSVMSPVVHIKDIQILAPQIVFEPGQGSNNLSAIQKNLARMASGQAPAQPASGANAGPQPQKKLIIDHFIISDAKATLALPQLSQVAQLAGQSSDVAVTLPTIEMRDLGTKEGGLPPAKIAELVMAKLEAQAEQSAADYSQKLMNDMSKGAGSLLNQGSDGAKGVGDQLKGLLGR